MNYSLQTSPVMPLYISSVLLGLQVLNGVLAGFHIPPGAQDTTPRLTSRLTTQSPTPGSQQFTLPPGASLDFKRLTPRKKHLKPKRLMRRMGKDFDNFWMSAEMPESLLETYVKRRIDTSLHQDMKSLNWDALQREVESLARDDNINDTSTVRNDTSGENSDSVLNSLNSDVLNAVQSWLTRQASCPVYFKWEDLGLLFWPRWVRRGMCGEEANSMSSSTSSSSSSSSSGSASEKSVSCSWPPGMHCVPARSKKLKILRWQCRNQKALDNFNRFKLSGSAKTARAMRAKGRRGWKKHVRRSQRSETESHVSDDFRFPKRVGRRRILWTSSEGDNLSTDDVTVDDSDEESDITSEMDSFEDENPEEDELDLENVYDGTDYPKRYMNNNVKDIHGSDPEDINKNNYLHLSHRLRRRAKMPREKLNSLPQKGSLGALRLKCKWIKIPYPVTDDCYCSC
ncbi:uncharacterized protein LOC101851957 isoform X2 [Aplysia californica]|uniref:Uncharacterized protein LOC101851957 isoform X2 n=1 Tax=Aplysia californica TaxID=6500 RepID=A0ABM0JTC9_APLCA|nr:uncharacterized protein LOC101851957 isoform X2 [Aplysia californica]